MRVRFKNRLFVLIISLLIIITVSGFLYFVIKAQLTQYKITAAREKFSSEVQAYANENIDFSLAQTLKLDPHLENFSNSIFKIPDLKDIKIYDTNGFVVAASEKKAIGENFISEEGIKKAANGEVSNTELDYKNFELTVYAPIKSESNSVKGIVSAKILLSKNLTNVVKTTQTILAISLSAGILILVLFYYLFSSAESNLVEKDRRIVEQSRALEEEEQLDEAIMSSIAESLIVINKNGQILVFNPEAERLTGLKSDDVEFRLYANTLIFCDKDGKVIKKDPITECLKTGQKVQANLKDGYFLKTTNKELIPVSVSAAPIMGNDNKINGVAATIQDVTTEKELDKVKDEFVFVVAHELGNPIFALDGYLSILENEIPKKGSGAEIVKTARGINQQLSGLVNDLLEVVRNEQGTLACEVTPLDVTPIIKDVINNNKFKADAKKIRISYKETKIPKILGNEQKLKEVVTNLVDNAIKYTTEGGSVTIDHQISEDRLVTNVKDNGLGISKEDQEHLFEKFYRVKTSKTERISGTGLGLFICRQIIEKCGGEIWAESEENKGSTFSFKLRIVKAK